MVHCSLISPGYHLQNSEALMCLGITELAAGNPEKAVGALDKAAELSPKGPV